MPVYEKDFYKVRDNQFWYSQCSFFQLINEKQFITIRITGTGVRTMVLEHSALGKDRRPTTSFKLLNSADRQWWKEHINEIIEIELLAVDGEVVRFNEAQSIGPDNQEKNDGGSKDKSGFTEASDNYFEVTEEIISKWQSLQFPKVTGDESFTWSGFDSAWTGKNPGAIAWMTGDQSGLFFEDVRMANFDDCLEHVDNVQSNMHFLMIDQPTIVQNTTGKRPVERAVSHEIGRAGGAVQPSNREKDNMFGDNSLIWTFLRKLRLKRFQETTAHIPKIREGRFYLETFPALGNLGMFGYNQCPKYNPDRETFDLCHWQNLCSAIRTFGEALNIKGCLISWTTTMQNSTKPTKATQDKLDAILCALFSYVWWRSGLDHSVIIGDHKTGYMVIPCFREGLRKILRSDASKYSLPVDRVFNNEQGSRNIHLNIL